MRRGKKIRLICSCFILLTALVIGGCGAKEQADSSKVQSVEATATPTATPEPTPEPTATSAPTVTPERTPTPIVLDAAFDEEFQIVDRRMYFVGRDDVSIVIKNVYTFEDNEKSLEYILRVGNDKYDGQLYWNETEGITYTSQPLSKNRIEWKELNFEEGKFTLMISETTDVQEPLVLSGNPEDVYVLERPEYVETEDFILFMDTGTKVYGNTVELIKIIFSLAEKETGLSMDAQADYYTVQIGPEPIFASDIFNYVDPKYEKYHIYVVPYEKWTAGGGYREMTLNPEDLEIAAGEGWVIVHEYIHSLHVANGPWMSPILNEGLTTYMTGRIAKKDEIINFDFDADYNYSYYPTEITRENAEQIFLTEPEDGWDDYLYGYRFMHFLMENYGEDIFHRMLAEALEMVKWGTNTLTREESAVCVKKVTSPNVFEEFGDWMQVNKKRFNFE